MKWVCSVCGYVYEGEKAPEQCPVCKAPASKFIKQEAEMAWAAEHVVGVAKDKRKSLRKKIERLNSSIHVLKADLSPFPVSTG